MNTVIEKNEKWLKFYSTASRVLGWTMILSVCLCILCMIMGIRWGLPWWTLEERREILVMLGMIIERIFHRLPQGIILLGVGQLLKYTYATEYKMPWLLRNGTKMLYLFAILAILRPFNFYLYQHYMFASHLTFISSFSFSVLAESLIFVGLGNILKRFLPILEEYKSLV